MMDAARTLLQRNTDDFSEVIPEVQAIASIETPLRKDAFLLDDEIKIKLIENHFEAIMSILGLDRRDDSLRGTPQRVAKMYVKEIFSGLNPANKPSLKLFDNKYNYTDMLIEKNITVYSYCEHHFVPIIGKAHVAYIPNGKVIALSKINRLVRYYSKRPQVQERLTEQIAQSLKEGLGTEHVAIVIEAIHLCVASRGIQDTKSNTTTAHYSGKFKNDEARFSFLNYIGNHT